MILCYFCLFGGNHVGVAKTSANCSNNCASRCACVGEAYPSCWLVYPWVGQLLLIKENIPQSNDMLSLQSFAKLLTHCLPCSDPVPSRHHPLIVILELHSLLSQIHNHLPQVRAVEHEKFHLLHRLAKFVQKVPVQPRPPGRESRSS